MTKGNLALIALGSMAVHIGLSVLFGEWYVIGVSALCAGMLIVAFVMDARRGSRSRAVRALREPPTWRNVRRGRFDANAE